MALKAAYESCVLFKNDGVLPLNKKTCGTVGVIGPNANSRAKKKLVIISEEALFLKGISNDMKKRNTSLVFKINMCYDNKEDK